MHQDLVGVVVGTMAAAPTTTTARVVAAEGLVETVVVVGVVVIGIATAIAIAAATAVAIAVAVAVLVVVAVFFRQCTKLCTALYLRRIFPSSSHSQHIQLSGRPNAFEPFKKDTR